MSTRRPLTILFTNHTLATRAGSEIYVRDAAVGMLRRGHRVIAYSPVLGDVAEDLRRATVPVVSDLRALDVVPDVIHAQHHLEAMTALVRFPATPALLMCHGWTPWQEAPVVFPSIRSYVAVDDLCRERLVTTPGLPASRVRTIYNGVDLGRFLRRPPLPDRPRRALIFSNYASDITTVAAIRAACARAGVTSVEAVGLGVGRPEAMPEAILSEFDLVFAKARCALEAMAVGCAVIVADLAGLAGLVTPSNVAAWRRLNFGIRTLQRSALTVEALMDEITAYDPRASAEVTDWIRGEADFERVLDALETCYADAVAEGAPWSIETAPVFGAAASTYLASLSPLVTEREALAREREASGLAMAQMERERETLRVAAERARSALAAIEQSFTWRLFGPYRRLRAWMRRRRP